MGRKYFVTGMPKAGKTTVLKKIIAQFKKKKLKVGGFFTPEEKIHGTRTGFAVQDIESGKRAVLAAIGIKGPKVAKYHVDIKGFESIVIPVLKKAGKYDVLIIDEIGRMEMQSKKFEKGLEKTLESNVMIIATVHKDFIEDYEDYGEVMMLTENNRDSVYSELLRKIESKPEKEKPKKSEKKEKPIPKKKKEQKKTKTKKKKQKEREEEEEYEDEEDDQEYNEYKGKHRKKSRLQQLYDDLIGF